MDLKINKTTQESVPVLELTGEVDVYTAPQVKSHLIDLVNENQFKIVVDLNNVDFMDSSGLGVLVGGLKRVKPHEGVIAIACQKEKILKIFRITGLDKVFPIYDDQQAASSSLR